MEEILQMVSYGYFDDENREYVITDPKTPVKWINYVGTLNFGGIVDHTGGSLICKGDPALNRIVKYIPQLPSSDFKGETAYIRIKQAEGSYKFFSPFFVPTLDKYDLFETHVGLGYQKIISDIQGIRTEVTIFVPNSSTVVIRDYRITNNSDQDLQIDLIPVVEYTHPDALKQFTNADWVPQTMCVECVKDAEDQLVVLQYPFMNKKTQVNFFTANKKISSFEADRKIFLGDNEYGSWRSPKSLQENEFRSENVLRGDNISALMIHLGQIKQGETVRVSTQLGQSKSLSAAQEMISKYRKEENLEEALKKMSYFWDEYLSKQQVSTPDASFNTMVNIHNPRQCHTTKNWSRYLSLYQLGLGARGIGFRDSSQDVLGVLPSIPEEAKELIKMLLSVQKQNGSAMHQFNPITMVANEGDSREEEGHKYYGDDHLWVIQSVCWYIKETGDTAFLDEEVPFYEKDKENQPLEQGTVLEHLLRAVEFTRNNVGENGLPLLGFADWNDTVNLKGKATSSMIANLYGRALIEMVELTRFLGKQDVHEKLVGYYDEMKEIFNEVAWDGDWYIRYFEEDGEPVGSNKCDRGKIYTNGQSWSVLSGFATPDRAIKALDSIEKHLNTAYGIKLSTPGYDEFDWRKGGVTTYPPGAKENGGIFLHSNPWVMIAEAIMGRGDKAFQYYQQINPATRNDRIEEFEAAPYNYPQNILGDEHPDFGLARNSWLSGTSSWTYTAATKFIMGVRPTYDGLEIDPCVPTKWQEFSMKRTFRGINYNIKFRNPDQVNSGVKSIIVDGKAIKGNKLPLQSKDCEVEVIMAKDGQRPDLVKKNEALKAESK